MGMIRPLILAALLLTGCQTAQPARAKVTPGKSVAGSEVRDDGPRSERTTIKAKRTHAPNTSVRIRIIERKPNALVPSVVRPVAEPTPFNPGPGGQGGCAGGSIGPAAGD